MSQSPASGRAETEIKVRLADQAAFTAQLPAAGFRISTPEALEYNILLDDDEHQLRKRGEILRIRRYAGRCIVTHKAPAATSVSAAHKIRLETETTVEDGNALAAILKHLGYQPVFVYEKLRTEWTDGEGHIVVDVTPIGDFAELEGTPVWIDRIASNLGIHQEEYVKDSYGQLFQQWKQTMQHSAANMTFAETGFPNIRHPA